MSARSIPLASIRFFFVIPHNPKSAVAFLITHGAAHAELEPPLLPKIQRRHSRRSRPPPKRSLRRQRRQQTRLRPPPSPIPPPPRQKLDERPQRPHLLARPIPHVLPIQSQLFRLGRHALESRRQRRHDSLAPPPDRARAHSRRRRCRRLLHRQRRRRQRHRHHHLHRGKIRRRRSRHAPRRPPQFPRDAAPRHQQRPKSPRMGKTSQARHRAPARSQSHWLPGPLPLPPR